LIGAELMRQKLGFNDILTLLALPAFFAAGALMIMNLGKSPKISRPPESL
jgi:AAHS family 4-hydroxybenzoate transporter-like MFS transporter